MSSRRSRLTSILILTLSGIFVLTLGIHFAGIAVLHYFAERVLHPAVERGTFIGEVHLNLFTGALEIHDFELRNQGRLQIRVGRGELQISPWALLNRELHVRHLALANAYLRVQRRVDGSLDLGLPAFGDPQLQPESEPVTPALRLDGLHMQRITLDYHDGELNSILYLESLQLGSFDPRLAEQSLPIDLRAQWDGASIEGGLRLRIASAEGIAADGRVSIEPVDVSTLQGIARLEQMATGRVAYQGDFAWDAAQLTLQGRLQIPELAYGLSSSRLTLSDLAMQRFDLRVDRSGPLRLSVSLQQPLQLADWRWQDRDQQVSGEGLSLTGTLALRLAEDLSLESLALAAQTLEWETAQQSLSVAELRLAGGLRHQLGSSGALPELDTRLSARQIGYADAARSLNLQFQAPEFAPLRLTAAPAAKRVLDSALRTGAGRIAVGERRVVWNSYAGSLAGEIERDGAELRGDLLVAGLRLTDPLFTHGDLTADSLKVEGLALDRSYALRRLQISQLALPAELEETALSVAAIGLEALRFDPQQGLTLDEVVIEGLNTGILRDPEGGWRHLMSGAGRPGSQATGAGAGSADDAPPPAWRIGGISLRGDSGITVADRLNPDMQPVRYMVERLQIGTLDSSAVDQDTPFDLAVRPDQYARLAMAGEVRPLAEALYLKAKGQVQGFGLRSVNGLIAKDLGHLFNEGQLDNEFSISIDQARLDMHNQLILHRLEVEPIEGAEGPPLPLAIALLEDRDGNIHLEVPIAGQLNDPQFRVLGALNPIIMKAVAGTAALAIQPLGSVLLVGGLVANQALKVEFAPAPFDPGSSTLSGPARALLGDLGGKLAAKPKLGLRLCGVVAVSERKRDKQGAFIESEEQALALAQRRADVVRAYLESQGVAATQLRACRPTLDSVETGLPRVEMRL